MQVTETLSDGLKRNFTVVLPAENLDKRRATRLADLSKTLKLPGFRPGKVPMTIVKQRFGTAVAAEVVDESVRDAMQAVMAERGLRPARQPNIALVTENPTEPGINLEFSLEMELLPTITLPDFSGIALTRLKTEVTPEEINTALGRIAKMNRTLEPLSPDDLRGRPEGDGAVNGDVLTVDFLGKIDGEPFEGGAGTDTEVEIGGEGFIPGFAEQLVGAKPGEVRTIAVTFPETYGKAELAGKPATFDITVKQLSRQIVPPVSEELALKLGVDTEAELRDMVRGHHQREYDQIARTRLKKLLLDALADRVDFPVPPSMAEQEFKQIWEQFEKARTDATLDEADKGKDEDILKAEYRAIAERRVRLGLLLAEIASANAITVSQQELDRALYARVSQYKGQEMQMFELFKQHPQLMDGIRGPLLEDKVVDFVLELATVTEQAVPLAELINDDDDAVSPAGQDAAAPKAEESLRNEAAPAPDTAPPVED